jgi:hypothetical protein
MFFNRSFCIKHVLNTEIEIRKEIAIVAHNMPFQDGVLLLKATVIVLDDLVVQHGNAPYQMPYQNI